jgi:hypothetical protein
MHSTWRIFTIKVLIRMGVFIYPISVKQIS